MFWYLCPLRNRKNQKDEPRLRCIPGRRGRGAPQDSKAISPMSKLTQGRRFKRPSFIAGRVFLQIFRDAKRANYPAAEGREFSACVLLANSPILPLGSNDRLPTACLRLPIACQSSQPLAIKGYLSTVNNSPCSAINLLIAAIALS